MESHPIVASHHRKSSDSVAMGHVAHAVQERDGLLPVWAHLRRLRMMRFG